MKAENRLIRLDKLRSLTLFLVPFAYVAVMCNSISGQLFLADDPGEMDYVRALPLHRLLFGFDAFGLFRPIKNLLWILFSLLEPFSLEWCHVFAIFTGILSFFPVLSLCRRTLGSEWKGLAAASIWLFSPTLVSSVAWLSCLNVQVMAAFAALAIVFHDKAWDGDQFRASSIGFAGLFLFLALLSYECAVAVALILLLFDALLRPERLRCRAGRLPHAVYWSVVFVYLVLRHLSGAKGAAAGRWIEATRGQLVVSSPYFTAQHFASWFWPFGRMSVGGSYVWGEVSPVALVGFAVLGIAVLAFAILARKRLPRLSFCILFALFGFAPTSNCLGLGNGPYEENYLTLASIGLAAGCVEVLWWLAEAKGRWRIPAYSAVAAFALVRVAAVPEAARWAHLWTRYDLAFAEGAKNYPDSVQNMSGSLWNLVEEEKWDEALEIGRRIEAKIGRDSPRMMGVYFVRFQHAVKVTRDKKTALDMLARYAEVTDPDETGKLVQFYRGCVAEILDHDLDAAEREYETALEGGWGKILISCVDALARIKARRGETEKAINLWEQARTVDPNNVSVLWNLAVTRHRMGDDQSAEELLEKVRELTGEPSLDFDPKSRRNIDGSDGMDR